MISNNLVLHKALIVSNSYTSHRWLTSKCILGQGGRSTSPGEEVAAKVEPVFLHQVLHTLFAGGDDGQPRQHRPHAILLSTTHTTLSRAHMPSFSLQHTQH